MWTSIITGVLVVFFFSIIQGPANTSNPLTEYQFSQEWTSQLVHVKIIMLRGTAKTHKLHLTLYMPQLVC